MKKLVPLIFLLGLASCGGVKKTKTALNTGNYAKVINDALKNLSKNKTKKGNQKYVLLLEEAFAKNTARELEQITFLENEGSKAHLMSIFESYESLKSIQGRIRPLLPLPVYDDQREARFDFNDYDAAILKVKNQLSEHLLATATNLLENGSTKFDFRNAYDDLAYLQKISPGKYAIAALMDRARNGGMSYVAVSLNNTTEQVIPKRLEDELLDFDTYNVDDFWTTYHTTIDEGISYDYSMDMDFMDIAISPEQVRETQVVKEKQVKDGFEYVLDENGNVAKDSLGNDIKVDRFVTVSCSFYRFTQLKTARIDAKAVFTDLTTNQRVNSYPLSSEFVFEHVYATHSGDRRALENDLIALLDLAAVPFPSNEQMVFDAGEDLKQQLATLVRRQGLN